MSDSRTVTIPDLVAHCPFPLRTSRHRASVATASIRWLLHHGGAGLSGSPTALHGLKAGRLAAQCYPIAGAPQLRVCCDFLAYLFHLDDLSDGMDDRSTRAVADAVLNALHHPHTVGEGRLGRMATELRLLLPTLLPVSPIHSLPPFHSYWRRLARTASPGTQARFIETVDLFFQAVSQQARDRALGVVPDLESYIELRRDTSGCKPCWALIEYANNLDIPDEVMQHPVVQSLGQAVNDLVTWSNVRA